MGEPGITDPTIRFGVFEVDARSGELRKSGIRIRVQDQPFKVLLALLERPGDVVTREDLRQRIWPQESFGDFDHAVSVAVAKLRTVLGDSADTPRYVETLPRRGYRFVYPVHPSPPSIASTPPPALVAGDTVLSPTEPGATQSRARRGLDIRRQSAMWSMAILIVAAGLTLWLWRLRGHSDAGWEKGNLQIHKLTNGGNVAYVAISPDGRFLAYALREKGGLGLWTRAVDSQSEVQILPVEPNDFRGLTFSPDGSQIYFSRSLPGARSDRNLYSIPILGGTPRLLIKSVDCPIQFSPDGKQFVFVRKDLASSTAKVLLADADGSGERVLASYEEAGGAWQNGASWSPDGKMIVFAKQPWNSKALFELDLISVSDGARKTFFTSKEPMGRPLWMPRGDAIISVLEDNEGHDQIWRIPYPSGAPQRLTHDLEEYHEYIDATRNGKAIVAIAWTEINNMFVQEIKNHAEPRQITFGQRNVDYVATAPNGRLVVHELGNPIGELWSMNPDGSQQVAFTSFRKTSFPARCGNFMVLVTSEKGSDELIRVDADGLNPKTLVAGSSVWSPSCPAEGKEVFYADLVVRPQKIMKVSIEGGPAERVSEVTRGLLVGTLAVSPDGKSLAYPRQEGGARSELVVEPTGGGAIAKKFFDLVGMIRWRPDGRALTHYLIRDGVVHLAEQELAGGGPRELTSFASGRVMGFDWSLDGKQLYLSQGNVSSDVVLINNIGDVPKTEH